MRAAATFRTLCTVAVLCCIAPAQQAAPRTARPAAESAAAASLRKRAEAAQGGDRAKLFTELARDEVEQANAKFNAGNADSAQADVARATADAQEATQAALTTRKRLKQTQLALHELSRRLDGIEHSLSAEDRPPVKQAVDRLQAMATQLLEAMFKHK